MRVLTGALCAFVLGAPFGFADEPTVGPTVTLVLGPGQAAATPWQQGKAHLGGGNIHVSQPSPDTISVTMTGAAAAGPHPFKDSIACIQFDLSQCFQVAFHTPQVKNAKLLIWGKTTGLMRSSCFCGKAGGTAEVSTPGHAAILAGDGEIIAVDMPPSSVACGESLSLNAREGPICVPVGPGKFTLRQVFGISAAHAKGLFGRRASAEFAPEPALEADWIGKKDPFHGAEKKDFGFQVILKVVPDDGNGVGSQK